MAETDWSQYEDKPIEGETDWSQYEDKPESTPYNLSQIPEEHNNTPEAQRINPFTSSLIGFNTNAQDIIHGLFQPLYEGGYLGQNNKERSINLGKERKALYEESLRQNPLATTAGGVAGSVGMSLPATVATGGAAALSKVPGYLKYLKSLVGFTAGGAASGASQYVNPGESRLVNSIVGAATGAGLGTLGVAGKAAINAGKKAHGTYKATKESLKGFKPAPEIADKIEHKFEDYVKKGYKPAEEIANKVAKEDLSILTKESEKLYKTPFDIAKNKGITKADIAKSNAKDYFSDASKEQKKLIAKAYKTKDLHDIHEASKSLTGYIYEAGKEKLLPHQKDALKAAKQLKRNMDQGLEGAFRKAGGQDAVETFHKANENWKKVVKNKNNKLLNEYRSGDLTPEDLVKSLYKDKKTRAHFSKEFPEQWEEIQKNIEVPKGKESKLIQSYKKGDITAEDLLKDIYGNKKAKAHFSKEFPDLWRDIQKHTEVPLAKEKLKSDLIRGAKWVGIPGGAAALGAYGANKLRD